PESCTRRVTSADELNAEASASELPWRNLNSTARALPNRRLRFSGVSICTIRPWLITAIRSHRYSASSRMCVVKKIVKPLWTRSYVQALLETVLLLDDSDPFSNLAAVGLEVEAQDVRGPGGRLEKRRQHLDRGRLSGSVRSEEAEHLRPLDIEAHAVDRGLVPIEPGQLIHAHGQLPGCHSNPSPPLGAA